MGLELPKRARRVAIGGLAVSGMLLLSGCSSIYSKSQLARLAMPVPATKEAPHIANLWQWSWLAAIITGIIVWALIFYAVVRFRRRRKDEIPVQTRYNLPIEIFYTIAPVMMVIVLFFFTVKTQNQTLHNFSPAQTDRTICVVGQQWSWTFNYNDDCHGKVNAKSTAGHGDQVLHETGTTAHDPTLWLVKGENVEFHLYSPDVIHSFWVTNFLFKMDVIPGRDNHFGLTPDRSGTYAGRCAELCGLYHSRMLFTVKVVNKQQYVAHMNALAKNPADQGPALGGNHMGVNEQPGLQTASANGGSQ